MKDTMLICKSCGTLCAPDALFCHKCGTKVEQPETVRIPKAMTVSEAAKIFFGGTVSQSFIYQAIREHKLPHVRMSGGKILLDVDELSNWWQAELEKSKNPVVSGLRRVL